MNIEQKIEQKIAQMYKSLEELQITEKLPSVKPAFKPVAGGVSISYDFSKVTDSATAANRVSQLLNNIASLKDHLKAWCKRQNKPFAGDALIDSNRDVAVVHDLWNVDKHAELNRPSRSGLGPRLENPPRSTMVLKGEPGKPSPSFVIPVGRGGAPIQTNAGASLRIVANVVDKDGNRIGDLMDICEKAVAAWEVEFNKVGLAF